MLALLLAVAPVMAMAAGAAGPTQSIAVGEVLRGRFVQERHLKGFNAPLRTEGHFVLAPGRGLIWRAEKPFAVTTVITANGLVQEVGGSETMRMPSSRLPFLSRLYDMLGGALAGDWRALETDFVVTRAGDDRHWQVDLTPRKADDPIAMPFHAITAQGSRFVETVAMVKPDGDADNLSFLDQALSSASLTAEEAAALDTLTK